VAPDKYELGDKVDEGLPLPNISQDSKPIHNSTSETSNHRSALGVEKKEVPKRYLHESIALDQIFYWECHKCCTVNTFREVDSCSSCATVRSPLCKLSALLEVALSATANAWSLDIAIELVAVPDRVAIPPFVLAVLLKCESELPRKHDDASSMEIKLDKIFYWTCSNCTVISSYTKAKCKTCLKLRTTSSASSTLLEIAENSAKWARTPEDATQATPEIHRRAIPPHVIISLITCVATVGKDRTCSKQKVSGSDFCEEHCEPQEENKGLSYSEDDRGMLLTSNSLVDNAAVIDVSSIGSSCADLASKQRLVEKEREREWKEDANVAHTIYDGLLSGVKDCFANSKHVFVHDTEDAILCDEKAPFPLGSLVRRFFSWYGFHDGRIVHIKRKVVTEPETGVARPVLLYRIVYDDGDKEDLMHHEVSSLRQLYNQRYRESTAIPSRHIEPGAVFECRNDTVVEVLQHKTSIDAARPPEGGVVNVLLRKHGGPLRTANLNLTELQVNIVRKIGFDNLFRLSSSVTDIEIVPPYDDMNGSDSKINIEASEMCLSVPKTIPFAFPVLEWPCRGAQPRLNSGGDSLDTDALRPLKDEIEVTSGLWLLENDARRDADVGLGVRSLLEASKNEDEYPVTSMKSESLVCVRQNVLRPEIRWDPADTMKFIHWDPYGHISCEICQNDQDEHQILICDECHLGYHMYCVRPVMVNVPTGEWRCPRCAPSRNIETSFRELVRELRNDSSLVVSFFNLDFTSPNEFHERFEKDIEIILLSKVQRLVALGSIPKASPTHKVHSLSFAHYNLKNDWLLPQPLPSKEQYSASLLSMVAAMRYCGMTQYSENLLYQSDAGVTESMNDSSLDTEEVGKMSQRNLDIFKAFKENMKAGLFPPIRLIYDIKLGFSMEAVTSIRKHTLIAEYIGEVTTVERSGETSSDSLMILLNTDDPKTSLVIDPSRAGNFARFLNGVNNANSRSLKKVNVRTRRFVFEGRCRVALFTSRHVEAGEKLCYDYNAGMMGKDAEEWAKSGFYDTSNFI
jgi:hypothetical protein